MTAKDQCPIFEAFLAATASDPDVRERLQLTAAAMTAGIDIHRDKAIIQTTWYFLGIPIIRRKRLFYSILFDPFYLSKTIQKPPGPVS
jgi:hypothetical protein